MKQDFDAFNRLLRFTAICILITLNSCVLQAKLNDIDGKVKRLLPAESEK